MMSAMTYSKNETLESVRDHLLTLLTAGPLQRAIAAGLRSIMPLQIRRDVSYPVESDVRMSPRQGLKRLDVNFRLRNWR